MIEVRQAQISDIPQLRGHLIRHGGESGNQGDLIFAPYEESWSKSEDSLRTDKSEKWTKPLTEPGWERCWIVANENGIYGELKLAQQPSLRTALHRTTLMMGIERSHRHQGLGANLINEAIS